MASKLVLFFLVIFESSAVFGMMDSNLVFFPEVEEITKEQAKKKRAPASIKVKKKASIAKKKLAEDDYKNIHDKVMNIMSEN